MTGYIHLNLNNTSPFLRDSPPLAERESPPVTLVFLFGLILGFFIFFSISKKEQIVKQMNEWKLLPQPERLTELYFEDHLNLPKRVEKGKGYPFRFTIHNLEYGPMTYPYEISAIEEGNRMPFATSSVSLKHDEYKTIDASFSASREYFRTQISVDLIGRNQPIHFWMDGITPSPTPSPKLSPTPKITITILQ